MESALVSGESPFLPTGTFVFSLDFELAWGTRGRPSAIAVQPDLDGTRVAIDGLLQLLAKYEISATWASVGGMFLGGETRHRWIATEEFKDIPEGDFKSQPRWYAEDILEQIVRTTPAQEIGLHTLTHMFVQDTMASRDQFDWELSCQIEQLAEMGLPVPRSFIFPKHYMAHFDLLAKHGIACFRGPENGWFEHLPGTVAPAIGRLFWGKLRGCPVVRSPQLTHTGLWMIPSSQYYPPFRSVGKYLSVADRVAKAKKGLRLASKNKGVFHLWTHPFNLGSRTDELLSGLDSIFEYAAGLRDHGHLDNRTMGQLAEDLSKFGYERKSDDKAF
ncbi:polysaccharide deacetylase [Rhodopirellula baltica WH47]|uniref:Polysaccharide deacetylase n=1 Tax=Rhodopirellula baltica WH47 TaxID=991778 RepID=F2AYZ9_RHOBT|nr:polysaccharide deacetylase [Rhodopirellula baltica WH47]